MSEPDFLPLRPGLRLEYGVRRAGEERKLVVEHSAGEGGSVLVRRTWTGADGAVETDASRGEIRPDGVYLDGERVLPRPAPAGRFAGCLRVAYLIAAGDGGAGERLYAPGVGLVREVCSDEADPFEVRLTAFPGAAEAAR